MKIFFFLSLLLGSQAWAGWNLTSYNIRNFDNDSRAGRTDLVELGKTIKIFQSDVMGFVEVVNLAAFTTLMKTNLPGYNFVNSKCGGNGQQKLAVAFNTKTFKLITSNEDLSFSSGTAGKCGGLRPAFLVTLEHVSTKTRYVFAALHLKAGGEASAMSQRWSQYEKLGKLVTQHKNQNLVLLGDLNTTGYVNKDEDFDRFDKFLSSSSMETMSEHLSCTSYWEGTLGNGKHQASVLDHIVLNAAMTKEVKEAYVGSHCAKVACKDSTPAELGSSYKSVSDHCPIQVTFQ